MYHLLIVATLAILLTACNRNARTIDEPTTSRADIEESLLDVEDLPEGWQFRETGDTYTPQVTYCGYSQLLADRGNYRLFTHQDGGLLSHSVTSYPDNGAARRAMDGIVKKNEDCRPIGVDDELARHIDFGPLDFPRLADDTFAMTNTGLIAMDLILVRKDNIIIELIIDNHATDEAEEISRLAVAKLP